MQKGWTSVTIREATKRRLVQFARWLLTAHEEGRPTAVEPTDRVGGQPGHGVSLDAALVRLLDLHDRHQERKGASNRRRRKKGVVPLTRPEGEAGAALPRDEHAEERLAALEGLCADAERELAAAGITPVPPAQPDAGPPYLLQVWYHWQRGCADEMGEVERGRYDSVWDVLADAVERGRVLESRRVVAGCQVLDAALQVQCQHGWCGTPRLPGDGPVVGEGGGG